MANGLAIPQADFAKTALAFPNKIRAAIAKIETPQAAAEALAKADEKPGRANVYSCRAQSSGAQSWSIITEPSHRSPKVPSTLLNNLSVEAVDKEIELVTESYREELRGLRALKRTLEAREQREIDREHADLEV